MISGEIVPVAYGRDSLQGGTLRHKGPKIHRVNHVEFVSDISGSIGFVVQSLPINPGQPLLFPWLSQIAARYEKYRFRSLKFLFQTEKSSATDGTVVIAVDYDAEDELPTTKTQLLNNEDKERGAPWQKFAMSCSQHNLRNTLAKFVRPGAVPSGVDVKTYDIGNLLIGTNGMADNSSVGELYVEYDVDLETPILESTGQSVNHGLFSIAVKDKVTGVFTAGAPQQIPFNHVHKRPDTKYYTYDGSGTLTVPPGVYLVSGYITASSPSSFDAGAQMDVDVRVNNVSYVTGGTALTPTFTCGIADGVVRMTLPIEMGIQTQQGDTVSVYVKFTGAITSISLDACWINITAC